MRVDIQNALLWLFIINLGIAFGAGLYEARIVVPLWTSAPPASLSSPDSGRRFWALVTTLPLTMLTIESLVATWHAPLLIWWHVAAVIVLVERLMTFGYFIPAMLRMQRETKLTAALLSKIATWQRLNYVRLGLTLVGWLSALKAFAAS